MRTAAVGVLALAGLSAVLILLGCNRGGPPAEAPVANATRQEGLSAGAFEDVTAGSGLQFTYHNGEEAGHATIFESVGGGVALLDYDGDGLLDIFLAGGGHFGGADRKEIQGAPCKLYKNLGGFKFKDVTAEAGLEALAGGRPWFYSHGCAVADYDNDGWPDLLVTGWGRVALFRNVPDGKGGRRFEDVSAKVGLDKGVTWATSAAFGDLDGDGYPDLYVCQYVNWSWDNNPPCKDLREHKRLDVCPPEHFDALPHLLFLNKGGRAFVEAGAAAGLRRPRPEGAYAALTHLSAAAREALRRADKAKNYGKGLGVLIADLDGDGRPDVYVANDTSGNFLYRNHGGGRFEEVGLDCGVAYDDDGTAPGSMGVDAADYDGSGRPSLFVTNFQGQLHGLYRNRGGGQFVFASRAAGLASLGRHFVGFGTGFFDFDLDGHEDLFFSNGHVVHYPAPPATVKQRPLLLRNLRAPGQKPHEVRFADVSAHAGPYFQADHLGRGAALGDLDNDGRVDLVLSPANEPAVVLRNRLETGHHWLGVALVGRPGRDAVGARLEMKVGGETLVRAVKGGGSYLSSGDRRVILGLGSRDRVGRLTVRWPSGRTQGWEGLAIDRYWELREGEPEARPLRGAAGRE
jgi:hypothetical protein